ncbi:type I-E CRISPR-associated protein Cas7/Cse4/CasC [Thauera aminoaromatica]|uniref:CRISPR-associated protein, Cse4 family n=1 Tax=Thauera aminoaromatica TaxID=164330 RepID=C4ZJY0_THASP|nr:type I-E CRISPR-associated protein Cas7/Cse4/CasC [Thauera aminoaromatica]ACK54971.1 CRISPR-associated protein, Cse4 family [Thauera aminoaromatica]
MSLPRFIQIHTLHTYPAALLNRDDAGLAKRLPYGGAIRTRISSQCLKRHWRVADDAFSLAKLGVPMATRTRYVAELIRQRLIEQGIDEARAYATAEALLEALFGEKADKKKEGVKALQTGQAVLFGNEEIAYLARRCRDITGDFSDPVALKAEVAKFLKEEKKNIEAMKLGSGLESALFGRMVTSDLLANRDASVSVAHAFTVHEAQVENDYFTVVDDFAQAEDGAGSAGIFDTELASGLYYGYVVIDVPQLVANLEGIKVEDVFTIGADKRGLAGKVVQHLLHLIATVSPGAKRGSTAPYDWAKFVLVEAGDWQPRSLAAAFHDPIPLKGDSSIRGRAASKLAKEIAAFDAAYGMPTARRFLSLDELAVPAAERATLSQLGEWIAQTVRDGAC